ncbi:MAG: hypothetical protein ABI249_03225, partial [Ornithinibacter sp.]
QRVDSLGRLTALAPTALGGGVLVGTIVGELTARPAVGIRRSAAVETRTVWALLPRARSWVLGASTTLLAAALGLGAAWGSPDDQGHAGRALVRSCTVTEPDGAVLMGGSRGPWPGSFYGLPLGVALLALAVLVAAALHSIVNRPRPELGSHGFDTMLRRWSVGTVLTAATVTVLGTLGPVALLMASALAGGSCPTSNLDSVLAVVTSAVGALATGAAFGLLAGLVLTPTIRVEDLPRSVPGDATPVGAPVR